MMKCSGNVEELNSLHHVAQMGVQTAKQQTGFTELTQSFYVLRAKKLRQSSKNNMKELCI